MYLKIYQKVCLKMAKRDQLQAIALMKRKQILKVSLKMVAMATSHSLWRFYLIALTVIIPALLQNKERVKARFIIEPVFFITVGTRDHRFIITDLVLRCSPTSTYKSFNLIRL